MANFAYQKFFEQVQKGTFNWENAVVRVMLERSTSTYTPDKDDDYVSDLTGFVEITATGYARQTLAGKSSAADDSNDRNELDCNNINFGNVDAGQIAKAMIAYVQIGGDDSTPGDDVLAAYIDTDAAPSQFPCATGGGAFEVEINVEGLIHQSC